MGVWRIEGVTWGNESDESGYQDGSALTGSAAPAWSALTGDLIFIVRDQQQAGGYVELENKVHWRPLRGTTRYIELTPAGLSKLRDGSAFIIEGQGAPSLPTSDTTDIDVPFDYVTARACLHLVAMNPGWWGRQPGAQSLPAIWQGVVADIEKKMIKRPRPWSVIFEQL